MDHIFGEISVQEVTKKDPIKPVQLYILNLLSKQKTLICGFLDFYTKGFIECFDRI